MSFSDDTRPRLRPKARLRLDRFSGRYMLLSPERGLKLSPLAAQVVRRCDGGHSVAEIVDHLAAIDGAPPREAVERAVQRLLAALADRGLVDG